MTEKTGGRVSPDKPGTPTRVPLRWPSMLDMPHGKHPPALGRRALAEGVLQAVVTGLIIAVVLTPVMIGFATMIYGHPDFTTAMPMLTKLIFMSSVAHQVVITCLSPMPCAIAQTQDAGLIFLSSMAVSIMTELGASVPLTERITTVVVHLSISSCLVGLGLIAIGKLRLASLVQYLPTPVIGGYLAYIGFFMIKGGLTLMTGTALTDLESWSQLLDPHQLALLAPGVVGGVLLSVVTTRYQHFAVFPCCLVLIPILFFVVVFGSGRTIEEARMYGYLAPETKSISLVEVYGLFDFSHIHWEVMFPAQIPTLLSMFLVISFASSLDIASICMGTGTAMNYNQQLQTVGTSNLVSGLIGGYTGSYIFSQTVFSFRFRPTACEEVYPGISRLVGASLALCEFGIAMVPFSLTTVVPKFLFGSVMIFIGVDLLQTWMLGVYSKMLRVEFATVVATFVFLNAFGVQAGLAAGVGLAALCFLVVYSRGQVVRVVSKTSNVIRNAEQHELLYSHVSSRQNDALMRERPIVTVELNGHIFFGSATRIQSRVKKAVYVRPEIGQGREGIMHECVNERLPLLASSSGTSSATLVNLKGQPCQDKHRGRTRFVVFNFAEVSGLDATATRSCFLALKMLFSHHNITVVYCGMDRNIEYLLRANDVIPVAANFSTTEELCHVTPDLDLALDWCEQQLILSAAKKKSFESGRSLHALMPSTTVELSVSQVFSAYLSPEKRRLSGITTSLDQVAALFSIQRWHKNERLFSIDEISDEWFVLLRGQVTLLTIKDGVDGSSSSSMSGSLTPSSHRHRNVLSRHRGSKLPSNREVVGRVRAGCIFGDMDFILRQERTIDAVANTDETVTAMITRETIDELEKSQPELALLIQAVVLRAAFMTFAEKLHSIVV